MKTQKYKPTILWSSIVTIGTVSICAIFIYSSLTYPTNAYTPSTIDYLIPIVITFLVFLYSFGRSICITTESIYEVNFFFFRKNILIKDINLIKLESTLVVGNPNRTLHIVANKNKKIDIPAHIFSNKIIQEIVNILKELSPNINFDQGAKDLLK